MSTISSTDRPLFILSYNANSESARAVQECLADMLGRKVHKRARDPVHTENAVCISWGVHKVPSPASSYHLNRLTNVQRAANKYHTFDTLSSHGVRVPDFDASPEAAGAWLAEGCTVVARHILTSHSGRGIQIVGQSGEVYRDPKMPDKTPWYGARLFTKYVKKADEYRVFVVGGLALFAYRKGLDSDVPEESRQFFVRTHATGWNFCSIELSDVPPDVITQSVNACTALALDFCAVDVGYNRSRDEATVFEVNTAPGLQGTSVRRFCEGLASLPVTNEVRAARRTITAPAFDTSDLAIMAGDVRARTALLEQQRAGFAPRTIGQ